MFPASPNRSHHDILGRRKDCVPICLSFPGNVARSNFVIVSSLLIWRPECIPHDYKSFACFQRLSPSCKTELYFLVYCLAAAMEDKPSIYDIYVSA